MADVLNVDELQAYLGLDVTDYMINRNLISAISVANAYLKGAVGEDYPTDDPRAKELAKIVAADIYNNRGMTEKIAYTTRKLVRDFELQLRLEMSRAAVEDSNE